MKMDKPMKSSKGMKDGKTGRMRGTVKTLRRGGPETPLEKILGQTVGGAVQRVIDRTVGGKK